MTFNGPLPALVYVGGGFLLSGYAGWRRWQLAESQDDDLMDLSVKRNWTYEPLGGAGFMGFHPADSGGDLDGAYFATYLGRVSQITVRERLRGEVSGMPFEAFQVRGLDGSTRHEVSMDTFGVASLKCKLNAGTFDIVYKDMDSFFRRVGKHRIETFNPAFDRHFWVNALEEIQAKRFLSPEVTAYLALHLKDIMYRLPDRFTLVWEGPLTAEAAVRAADFLEGLWGVVPAELKG